MSFASFSSSLVVLISNNEVTNNLKKILLLISFDHFINVSVPYVDDDNRQIKGVD